MCPFFLFFLFPFLLPPPQPRKSDVKAVEQEPSMLLMVALAVGVIGSFTLNGISMEKITGRDVSST